MKRLLGWVGVILALIAIGGAGYLWYLGYFASDPYKAIPANPDAPRADYAIAFLSGDMGFNAGMGPKISERFVADGVPVLGFNSLTFFRTRRTPQEVEAMVQAVTKRTMLEFGVERVVLFGQSFGADALHLGLPAMPEPLRQHIAFVALVVPTDTVFLQASPGETFNWYEPDLPALPTARQLNWVPALCIHGAEEAHSLCPLLTQPNMVDLLLPGGHGLKKDPDAVYLALKAQIAARARSL